MGTAVRQICIPAKQLCDRLNLNTENGAEAREENSGLLHQLWLALPTALRHSTPTMPQDKQLKPAHEVATAFF